MTELSSAALAFRVSPGISVALVFVDRPEEWALSTFWWLLVMQSPMSALSLPTLGQFQSLGITNKSAAYNVEPLNFRFGAYSARS